MKCYFHCNANMYRRRVRTFLEYTAAPVVFIAVFLTVCMLLSLRNLMHSGLLIPAVVIIGSVIFAFALITRIMLGITEHRVRTHSKYTYIEIGLKDIIVSLYAGSFTHRGETTVIRKLLVIPLDGFESAEVGKSGLILIKGKIRAYIGNSDRLGYYFVDGRFKFKEFFYEEQGFVETQETFIKHRFENAKKIINSLLEAKNRFNFLPSPKPYVFRELPTVKQKKIRDKSKHIRNF